MANNGIISSYDLFKVINEEVDGLLNTLPNLEYWSWSISVSGPNRVFSDGEVEMELEMTEPDPERENKRHPTKYIWLVCKLSDDTWRIQTSTGGKFNITHATIDAEGNIDRVNLTDVYAPFTTEFIEKILDKLEHGVLKNRRVDSSPSAVDLVKSIMSEEEIAHADMIYEQMFGDLIDE